MPGEVGKVPSDAPKCWAHCNRNWQPGLHIANQALGAFLRECFCKSQFGKLLLCRNLGSGNARSRLYRAGNRCRGSFLRRGRRGLRSVRYLCLLM